MRLTNSKHQFKSRKPHELRVRANTWSRIWLNLSELRERFGVQAPFRRIRANLIDRTVSETQPQYVLTDDEDLVIRPQYLADSTVNLGSHHTEEAAIARCQEHHDTIYGRNA